jgi:hypothetical protein
LKDSWNGAPAALEELEKEGEILVIRTNKDGQMKMVFWNEINPRRGMTVEDGENSAGAEGQGAMVEKGQLSHSGKAFVLMNICRILGLMAFPACSSRCRPRQSPSLR